ncbi:MAG: hypothetical protein U9R79_19225 [Armatimonadota bacterium]|nr:hypothetical protein [Armatimonadota bacterium]
MEPPAEHAHDEHVLAHLRRLYATDRREFAFTGSTPGEVQRWQDEARPALRKLLGLQRMEQELPQHRPAVELDEAEQLGGFTRRLGRMETEPGWWLEFWLLRPEGEGPFPLAVTPHGHEARGHDTYAGAVGNDEQRRQRIAERDADVAVQAVERGFLAVAPNMRGFDDNLIPDVNERHDARGCRSELIHALLAGRTVIGERVRDLERLLDWAAALPEVDGGRILMVGNSGGGMATTYAAACDTRVTAAIPSCSFVTYVGENGIVHHCDCNTVPGIYRFGEFSDVAGLIAPRHLLVVTGRADTLFPPAEVERAVEDVRRIYQAAAVPERFEHRWGEGGHRFYSHLMWPWVEYAMTP